MGRWQLLTAVVLTASSVSALQQPCAAVRTPTSVQRTRAPVMDETMLEKALAGELEQEGAENVFMTEVGWATYLDKEAKQSYNMNERVSMAQDGYFTADIFSNPIDVASGWLNSMLRVAKDPLESSFMTISNDKSGSRSYGAANEVGARTIKPKVKNFDKDARMTNIPGYNLFGTPSSKSAGIPTVFGTPEIKGKGKKDTKKAPKKGGFSFPNPFA